MTKIGQFLKHHAQPLGAIGTWFGAGATFGALVVALFQPGWLRADKAMQDIIVARNLVYLPARLVETTMIDALASDHPHDTVCNSKYDFKSSFYALNAISIKEISPEYLSPYFVDIHYAASQADALRCDDNLDKKREEMGRLFTRTRVDIEKIDAYLDEKRVRVRWSNDQGDYGKFYLSN